MDYLPLFLASLALSWALTWVVRFVAPRVGLVDVPREDRWHRRPVPRLGGVAIFLGFVIPLSLFAGQALAGRLLPLLVGGGAIFLVGLADDLVRLENRPKLLLLILCSTVPVLWGARFESLPGVIGAPLAILWILVATNAFNWLDNMDGVAGGVATIASAFPFVLWPLTGNTASPPLPLLPAGARPGFSFSNFPPAKIFIGYFGRGILGLTLATI